jgi:TM2 domain-containing membrane protein YozV
MTVRCPECSEQIDSGARTCPFCGKRVATVPSPASSRPDEHIGGPLRALDPKDKLFCEIAIDLGFISYAQATQVLEQQRIDGAIGQRKPVGAYLHAMKLLEREQIAQILKVQDRVEKAAPIPMPQQPVAQMPPQAGSWVTTAGNTSSSSSTSRVVYILLAVFLGTLGVHNFVAGYTGRGIAQLLITFLLGWLYGLGVLVTAIWALVEAIAVTKDAQGRVFS